MSRYIDADAVIDDLELMYEHRDDKDEPYNIGVRGAINMIRKAPTIDIVRCKECKHYDKFPTWSACTYWSGDPYEQASVNPNDFCSYGEREGE